jgi:Ethylbenzene dehydrogenase
MSRHLRLGMIFMFVMALTFMFACEGDQGLQGPTGETGEPGTPGENLSTTPPDDVYLSLAIFNQFDGVETNYSSTDFLRVTFDDTQTPSPDLVVASFVDRPPILDGEDGDIDEWGDGEDIYESNVSLGDVIGRDNNIGSVRVRCVYDEKYIYFFLYWEEKAPGFEFSESRNFEEWEYQGFNLPWETHGSEDRVWLMFLTDLTYVPSTGTDCLAGCGLENASFGSDMMVDVWDWRASLTDVVGFADDGYLYYSGGSNDGIMYDNGGVAFMRNIEDDQPVWMHYKDPGHNADYPFWFRNAVPLKDSGFVEDKTIPGYMALIPYGDRGQIAAGSVFELPFWTVELRRLRNTGSGNDIQF